MPSIASSTNRYRHSRRLENQAAARGDITRRGLSNLLAIESTTPALCALVLVALLFAPSSAAATSDLSVAWISRRPSIDYVWASPNPRVVGWPEPGDDVTWVANVRNLSGVLLDEVEYRWLLDGEIVASGTVAMLPRRVTQIELAWTWERKRHELEFQIDPSDAIEEVEERNNRLLVHTDALAVGFWVERRQWNRMRRVVTAASIGATTFDDWMQLRVRQFNEMAQLARYPGARRGVRDRWRIDEIRVVPNGSLPLSPLGPEVRDWGADPTSYPTLYPDTEDRSVDLEWGFPASSVWFKDYGAWELLYDSLVHELGHARYLIDVYAWSLSDQDDIVDINPGPPTDASGRYFTTPESGLMHHSWGFIDRYSALALNRIAGHRATRGHYNEPSNIGVFLNDLPASARLRLVTTEGAIFPDRPVRIYRASGERDPDWMSHPYQLRFDGEPDIETTTDASGSIQIDGNPFSEGAVSIEVDRNNALAIVQLIDGQTSHWAYLEARELNIEYWRGRVNAAQLSLTLDPPICPSAGIGPNFVSPAPQALLESREVTFEWPDVGTETEVWYSIDGRRPRVLLPDPGAASASRSFPEGERIGWWIVYRRAGSPPDCPKIRSATYFFDLR